MLTYIAIVIVQFVFCGTLMVGTARNLDAEFGMSYEGLGIGGWAMTTVTSLVPVIAPVGMLIGFAIAGSPGFSLKWTADIPKEAP